MAPIRLFWLLGMLALSLTACATVTAAQTAAGPPTGAKAVVASSVADVAARAPDPTISTVAPDSRVPLPAPSSVPRTAPAAPPAPATPAAPTPRPAAASLALPQRASLGPLITISQTYNNCGPAAVAEVLRYWGIARTQAQVQGVLRADGNPRGMVLYGVPAYARSLGLESMIGVEGNDTIIKALVANGFPVIVSQWVSDTSRIAHFRPIEAYDDTARVFTSSDTLMGAGYRIPYDEFNRIWTRNDYEFTVIYPPKKQALLDSVLASTGWDRTAAYQGAMARMSRWGHGAPEAAPTSTPTSTSTDHGGYTGFRELATAWNQLQLGQLDAAAESLRQATAQRANAVLVGWIASEVAARRTG